jgi:hypothetical protein
MLGHKPGGLIREEEQGDAKGNNPHAGNGLQEVLVKWSRNCRNSLAKILRSHEPHAHEIPAPPVIRHADLKHELRPLRQGRDSGGAGRQDEVV